MAWEKMNLVTTAKGDKLRCTNCGNQKWWKRLQRPDWCAKCGCGADVQKKPDAVKGRKMMGVWRDPDRGNDGCPVCKKPMVPTPREGHPNSIYWARERNDGMKLYNCEVCPE